MEKVKVINDPLADVKEVIALVLVRAGLSLREARNWVMDEQHRPLMEALQDHHFNHQPDPNYCSVRRLLGEQLDQISWPSSISVEHRHTSAELVSYIEHGIHHQLNEHQSGRQPIRTIALH